MSPLLANFIHSSGCKTIHAKLLTPPYYFDYSKILQFYLYIENKKCEHVL